MRLDRHRFLATGAALAQVFAPGVHAASREALQRLGYDQVRLTGGPLSAQYDAIHAHYLGLSNDRLLKVYRQNAGLAAPGEDMGGWYDLDGFVPGHALGQFISGLSRIGASTGDPACHKKVQELVTGFAETLGPNNSSILVPDINQWPCYTLDKHFAGLIDAYTLSNITDALPLMSRVLAGGIPLMPAKGRDRIGVSNPPYDETFVMPENLFTAAELTGNPDFTDYAHRYLLNKEFFDVLASGGDPLPGQHAYSHAIALSSGAMAYLVTGDERYRRALNQAFHLITTQQQFASGGWGPDEAFVHPHEGALGDSLHTTSNHFETPCGTYAASKLARYLLRITPAPTSTEHGDYLERVLFNAILAVKPPDTDGDYFYYSNYSARAEKTYYSSKWPCCSGTLVQTVSDYPQNLAFSTNGGLYVNFYTPSTISFDLGRKPMTLTQATEFPAEDTVTLTLGGAKKAEGTLVLRIPAWTAGSAAVTLNGKHLASGKPGEWLPLKRTWSSGDVLTLTLPQDFRLEPIDDKTPDTVALMRGPVQYVAIEPTKSVTKLPSLSSLHQDSPQVFTTKDGLTFVPLYLTANDLYTSYFSKA